MSCETGGKFPQGGNNMVRFQYNKKKSYSKSILISITVFVVLLGVVYYGINSISERTSSDQRTSLENALQRGITQCYALEGSYPESLDYLKGHYGITYNGDKFFVDYKASGSNILPDVTIIERGDSQP